MNVARLASSLPAPHLKFKTLKTRKEAGMYYAVRARLKPETAAEFLTRLTDGTIEAQKPDGREIVASMNRAVVTETGEVAWSEVCFCSPPLAHERETVYDRHFEGMTTQQVDSYQAHEGAPFMEHLQTVAGTKT